MEHQHSFLPRTFLAALFFSTLMVSCKKDKTDDPVPPVVNEEELITTLTLHLHSTGGAEHKHFRFEDLDGPGGNAPVITVDTLTADSVYDMHLELLNASVTPAINITQEIEDEADEHQFFFQISGVDVQITYADADGAGFPVGLENTVTVGVAGIGTLRVTLRHQPDKAASGVSGGDISNAGGETDVEVEFPLHVQP